jgi:outer membrane lipoprotein-sorting protein
VDTSLGLPPLPDTGQASSLLSDGTSQFQVWTDGHGRERMSIPSKGGEMTVVNDGSTVWQWDSTTHTVTESHRNEANRKQPSPEAQHKTPPDPATASRNIVDKLRQNSNVTVDGTASVAGRDAYELVLTPKPNERTLLREVRIAVDAQKRVPLQVEVDTNGSSDPALKVGFSQLDLSNPNPSLFQFTPPPGAKVQQQQPEQRKPQQQPTEHKVVGSGWDSVLVTRLPQQQPSPAKKPGGKQPTDLRALASRIGKPVSGPWGNGWIISTRAVTALVTSDGRLAVGAVPEQVLTSAIGQA